MRHLPQEWSLLCGPVQSVYSRTERAEAAESVACTVFDTVPVAGWEQIEGVREDNKSYYIILRGKQNLSILINTIVAVT